LLCVRDRAVIGKFDALFEEREILRNGYPTAPLRHTHDASAVRIHRMDSVAASAWRRSSPEEVTCPTGISLFLKGEPVRAVNPSGAMTLAQENRRNDWWKWTFGGGRRAMFRAYALVKRADLAVKQQEYAFALPIYEESLNLLRQWEQWDAVL